MLIRCQWREQLAKNLRGFFPLPFPGPLSNFFESEASLGEARRNSSGALVAASRVPWRKLCQQEE